MKLPLNEKPYYNTDSIANNMSTDDMIDCYLEPVPGEGFITRRRPGLTEFVDLGTDLPGDGIYDWETAEKVIAVSGGQVFDVSESGTATEIVGLGEDESPLYEGGNHENWNLGTGWQVPVKNQSEDNPPILYKDLKAEYDPVTTLTNYPFEYVALAKNADGTGHATPVQVNTTIVGIDYEVVIRPHVTAGSASYTLGGAAGSSITGVDTITDTITTTTAEGLVITPTTDCRMVLTISWRANLAERDYPVSGTPVIFDDGQDLAGEPWLYMAMGKLIYLTEDDLTLKRALSFTSVTDDSYAASTHVAWINSRFIANESDTNRFYFTDTNPNTNELENNYWQSTDNPVTCDYKGDKLASLFAAWQEIFAWGTQGLQVFQDDGTPFVNVPGASSEVGLEAVYSIKKIDNTLYALCVIDGKRVVVKFQGRTPQVISEPIASILSGMETVSDAIGDVICVGGIAIYLLNFPTANQSWAYDYRNDIWLRWGYWNKDTGTHDMFLGQHCCFVKRWNKYLIMSRIDGKIYELSRSVYDDDGELMVSYRRTGWVDHGDISRIKHSKELFIKVKTFSSPGITTTT